MISLEEVRADLAAFADDDEDLIIEPDGSVLLVRGGRDVTARLFVDNSGETLAEIDGTTITYRQFITHHLARLDVFAERLLAKRTTRAVFVDGPARLDSPSSEPTSGGALELLNHECSGASPFAARVSFVTADAGQGKTVLLREHQFRQAESYLEGSSPYLFWHVDLQGRQLVRLSEALMGDLGDLRLPGLWMPAILRLIRMRALVLAIDGFDELAAEQGSTDALGALALLVRQMDGRGVVVAASRRTFFDTEDYLKRAGLLRRAVSAPCEFDQIALGPWTRSEDLKLFRDIELEGSRVEDPEGAWDEFVVALGGDERHPMLTRPFLVTQLARGLILFHTSPADFIRGMDDPLKGVAAVVEAFVQREVSEKWRHRDTGEPYLTIEQHMELLGSVAEEMYRAQKDRLSLDVIETLAAILMEQWSIEQSHRQNIAQMVRMHVLLTPPAEGSGQLRSFDHAEFRDYFVAYSFHTMLESVSMGAPTGGLADFLSIAQITDSTARYVTGMLSLDNDATEVLLQQLSAIVKREWRSSFLQLNVGTLLPFIIDGRQFDHLVVISGPAILSSVILENTNFSRVKFEDCTFLNASFSGVRWSNVQFNKCTFGELTIDAAGSIDDVLFDQCSFSGLRVLGDDGEELDRQYAPSLMHAKLLEAGFSFVEDVTVSLDLKDAEESPLHKQVHRFLRMFYRSTVISDNSLRQRFRGDYNFIVDRVIPIMTEYGLIEERPWRGSGTGHVWSLNCSLDELLVGEEPNSKTRLGAFWETIAALH